MHPKESLFEKLTFLRNVGSNPLHTGAICPSGPFLAKEMAAAIDPDVPGTIVELGPGTGSFTKALLRRGIPASRLLLIEFNDGFVTYLRRHLPEVNVVHGSAFDLANILKNEGITNVAAVVSGLPLLNFPVPMRVELVESALGLMGPGGRFVQFTYGGKSSVPLEQLTATVTRTKRIWRNVPPATLWVYERSVATARATEAA